MLLSNYKLILIEPDTRISDKGPYYVLVDSYLKIRVADTPMHVAEKLTDGTYDVFQIDNAEDIDSKNQYVIIADNFTDSKLYRKIDNTKEELDEFLAGKKIADVHIETFLEEYQGQYIDGSWTRSMGIRIVPKLSENNTIKILNRVTTNEEMKDALVRVLELFHPNMDSRKEEEQEELLKFIKKIVKK